MTYFKPKNLGDVRLLLGGIDDNVPVTLTSGVQLPSTVRTVGDLRRLTAWPTKHRLVVERAPFVEVRVELVVVTMRDRRAEDMVVLGECGLRCPKEGNAARGVRHSLRGSG